MNCHILVNKFFLACVFLFSIFVADNNIEINEAPFNDIHVSDVFVL